MTVKVVTDSTSDLPRELADRYGINVIPQKVIFGTEELRDGVDITGDEFYRRVSGSAVLPTTSQASPGEFRELYESIADGADGIVSVHVSAALSGTVDSARSGGEQADIGCSVEVIDSMQAGMGTGLVAVAAARAAMNGGDLRQVVSVAESAVGRSETYVLLDTLEYLQKGGRIGKARAMLATLLSIKPMIILREGIVDELGKERTHRKGVARLRRVTEDFAHSKSFALTIRPRLTRRAPSPSSFSNYSQMERNLSLHRLDRLLAPTLGQPRLGYLCCALRTIRLVKFTSELLHDSANM